MYVAIAAIAVAAFPLFELAVFVAPWIAHAGSPYGRIAPARIMSAGDESLLSRDDLYSHSSQWLAKQWGVVVPGTSLIEEDRSGERRGGVGDPLTWPLRFAATTDAGAVCESRLAEVPMEDVFVFPIGWRVVPSKRFDFTSTYALAESSAAPCEARRDFDLFIHAKSLDAARRGIHFATRLVGRRTIDLPDDKVLCGFLVDAFDKQTPPGCDALEMLGELSLDWFVQVDDDDWTQPGCEHAVHRDVLLFEDPRARGYPRKLIEVHVCSTPSGADDTIVAMAVVRDDIA
jgi:hypothetical protein